MNKDLGQYRLHASTCFIVYILTSRKLFVFIRGHPKITVRGGGVLTILFHIVTYTIGGRCVFYEIVTLRQKLHLRTQRASSSIFTALWNHGKE